MIEITRHAVMICDVCGRPTERLVGKISFCPTVKGVVRLNWNNYTHTADVGECCKAKLFDEVKFTKRMTAKQYQEKRRQRANHSTTKARIKDKDADAVEAAS